MDAQPMRPLRADARQNHERVPQVAAEAFAREGAGASLEAVAQEAGVGVGTLCRRFPTRETLVEAVYRNEVACLCVGAGTIRPGIDPYDLLMGLGAVALVARGPEQRALAPRLPGLILDGVRSR